MTDFLVKKFIKDYNNTDDIQVRTRYGMMAGIVGIFCNVLLFLIKLIIGIMVNSISVMADAFNNLSDAASSIIGFIGVKMAEKPADEDHPFGHGRIEYIAGFIVAFIVLQVAFSLFRTSIGKIRNPEEMTFSIVSIAILSISICIKLWLGIFNRRLGKRINSTVMAAAAADAIGDVITTAATIFSIIIFGIFNLNIDGIIGVIVSIVVFIAGINIAKDTLTPLIGEAIDPEVYEEITNFVEGFDGIIGTHDLIVHNYGPSRSMASIHAEVASDVNIEESHEVIDNIERESMRRFNIMLVIHMDPVETKDNRVREFREIVADVIKMINPRLDFHDFRMVTGVNWINLIFDLVVPMDIGNEEREHIKSMIEHEVNARDSRCHCVITVESSYCALKNES